MVELFVGDVGSCVDHLEWDYVLAVGLVCVVGVRDDMAQHDLYVCLGMLKGLEFPHEDGPVLVLLPHVVNALLLTNSLARRIGSHIQDNS